MLFQFIINGIITGLLFSLAAISFGLVYNSTRVFHIAFAALYVVPCYIFLSLMAITQDAIILAAIGTVLLNALLSVFVEKIIYLPLHKKNTSHNLILIASLGVSIILINLIAIIYGNETKVISNEISESISYDNLLITYNQLYQGGISLTVIVGLLLFLNKSNLGVQIRAIRDDIELSEILGINVVRIRTLLFALSGGGIAVVACLISYDIGFDPYIGMPLFLNAMVALIIGGVGSYTSPLVGGLLLGITQALSVYYFESRWENALTFGLLILFLLFRPQGIFGEKNRAI